MYKKWKLSKSLLILLIMGFVRSRKMHYRYKCSTHPACKTTCQGEGMCRIIDPWCMVYRYAVKPTILNVFFFFTTTLDLQKNVTLVQNGPLNNAHLRRLWGGASGVAGLALEGVWRVLLRFGELSGVLWCLESTFKGLTVKMKVDKNINLTIR